MQQHLSNFAQAAQQANAIPMLRPLYKAECHIFNHREHYILFDVVGGGFFEIDSVALSMISRCNGHTLKDLMELLAGLHSEKQILSAFKELYELGILSDMPPERPTSFAPPDRMEIIHLDLQINMDALGNTSAPPAYMSETTALKAVDLLLKESGFIRQCRLAFRGGEPLLHPQLVEKTMAYAQEKAAQQGKDIAFEIVTDGRLLNEELLNRLESQNATIAIRINGDHNAQPMFQGSGAYSLSSQNIERRLQTSDAPIHVNHVIHQNIFDIRSKIQSGLAQYPTAERISLSFEPVQSASDLPQAQAALEDLARYVTQHVLNGKTTWIGDFEDFVFQVANQKAFFNHCGAGVRTLTVAPDGALYADPDQTVVLGDVEQGIDRKKQKSWLRATHVDAMAGCTTCWARNLCGGACRITTSSETPPDSVPCAMMQRTYELAMATCLDIEHRDAACLQRRYAAQSG